MDKMIEHLCKELEIPNELATEVPGVFSLPLDKGLYVLISTEPPGFTLSCDVADVPVKKEADFLREAMIANVLGQGTEEGVLGLNEAGNKVVMSRKVDWDADKEQFLDIVEEFINGVDFWREETKIYQ